jgi:hypothetical protein
MSSLSGFLRFLLPFSILFTPWRTQLSLKHTSPSLTSFYILVLSFLPFLWILWIVVFSLVLMTEPYASHDASEIEPYVRIVCTHVYVRIVCMQCMYTRVCTHCMYTRTQVQTHTHLTHWSLLAEHSGPWPTLCALYIYIYIFICIGQYRLQTLYMTMNRCILNASGWSEPYIYAVYDRILCIFPAKNYRTHTVYIYLYGSGQPYIWSRLISVCWSNWSSTP